MSTRYQAVIGLEVHVELKTRSKIFCSCSTEFGKTPNGNVCPVCLGSPGTLPVLNREVVEFAIRTGLALNARINPYSKFDRKNYFYPDLSKNYQNSQYDMPICQEGWLEIEDEEGALRRIGINRAHMEEDAGKLVHDGADLSSSTGSLVDYNRVGVPLLEIVSEPDIRSAAQARAYAEELRRVLRYIDVSDCRMEEGSLRVDANVSLRPVGQDAYGTRTETKNMNSFKALGRAIEYEIERQRELLESGQEVVQETRMWDEARGITVSMRSKEEAHDYRYFPEPDLPPVIVDERWVESVRRGLPELPASRRHRLVEEDGLTPYEAMVLTGDRPMADYYDAVREATKDSKLAASILMGDFSKALNELCLGVEECPVTPAQLSELLGRIQDGTISKKIAKTVLPEMVRTGRDPGEIIREKGLVQVTDEGALEQVVDAVLAAHPQSVADYRGGKDKALGFLVGQVMKETGGKANPGIVNRLLREKLGPAS